MTSLLSAHKIIIVAAILLGVAVILLWRASLRETRWENRYPPTGQFVSVNGLKVHYKVIGSGPDLVLIHGASGNFRDMETALGTRLAARYRVFMFDRPGLGYTERAAKGVDSASPREQAAMLQAAAAELGAPCPIVVGHSYGGAVALAWAVYHPDAVAGVVDLAGAAYPWEGRFNRLYDAVSLPVLNTLIPLTAAAIVPETYMREAAEGVFAPDPVVPDYYEAIGVPLVARRISFRANAMQVHDLKPFLAEQSQLYGQISVPVEIVHGSGDTTVGLHVHSVPLSDALPQANLTVIEGAGHMIHQTYPDVAIEAIDRIAAAAGLNSDLPRRIVGAKDGD